MKLTLSGYVDTTSRSMGARAWAYGSALEYSDRRFAAPRMAASSNAIVPAFTRLAALVP